MKPDFTETEKYVIAYTKGQRSKSGMSVIFPDLLCLFFAISLAGYAWYSSNYTWLIVSFVFLVWSILKNAYATKTYALVYRDIFKKYDEAIQQLPVNEDQDLD